ncbi:DUF6571 family protein [Streptomyces sp. TRM49041]|uniref:DUF6571 family protein n=1 Tax=Streptomyces sp. TRM49041 TaxID=2603216 RepID=UPI0011EF6532|nr:DUF6571 family protein [Streptomyces sp. TRM49041]
MALTYKKVMETDYGKLTAAAKAWDDMAGEFKKAESNYAATVRGLKPNWRGEAFGSAYVNFAGTQYEYAAAQTEAKAIADLLRDAHGQFTELKKRLESLVADARKDNMQVDDEGNVRPDLTDTERRAFIHDPDGQALLKSYTQAAASWAKQIQKYVKAIEDADAGVKLSLEGAVKDSNKDFLTGKDDTANGFNAGAKGDIEQYELEYVQDVTTRLNEGKPVSNAEIEGAARILRDNNNEAFKHRTEFSRTFLSSLGAEGTLKLTNRLNDLAYFDDKGAKKPYPEMQKSLANTMAIATQVPEMEKDGRVLKLGSKEYAEEFAKWRKTSDEADFYNSWLEDIKRNGTEEFSTKVTEVNRSSGIDQKALGYQSLVTLMQRGSESYSAPFLHELADSMRAAEDPTRGGNKDIWDLSNNFDSKKSCVSAGWFANDPLDGLLGVMSKNPDAATTYFDPDSHTPIFQKDGEWKVDKFGTERLEYLQTKRDWDVVDEYATTRKDGATIYKGDIEDGDARVGFGAALEAAATGNVPGTPAPEEFAKHTAAQTRVLESVITSYAEIAKIDQTAMPANIRVNMANALAYYPGDVHQILVDQVDYAVGSESTDPNGLGVSTEDMRKFIRAASEDGGAFRMIHDSQMGHITERISSLDEQDLTQRATGNNDHAMGVVIDAGMVIGTLDEVRADALIDERDRQTSENNWNKAYNYHMYGAPVTSLPIFGDSIQRSIDILTGKHAEELNNAVADKTKEQLIEHYNKHGYPRLRNLINHRADILMIPEEEKIPTGGRMGSLRTAAGNSYTNGIELTQGSAGE